MRQEINKRKTFLPAFTIIEIIFVMILSAIVVSLAYTYFIQFRYYLKTATEKADAYTEFCRFRFIFNKDMTKAEQVRYPASSKIIFSEQGKDIIYDIEEDFVVRESGEVRDTFDIYTEEPVVEKMENYNDLVHSFTMDVEIEKNKFLTITTIKKYPSECLFENYKK